MNEFGELHGKVVVVTGGASGIGKGIAQRFIAHGARVVIADIEETSLQNTAREIGAYPVRTDVSDRTSVQALAEATLKEYGRVDILCNNAGVGPMANISDMTLDDWQWLINVNLWGVIHGVHTFLPLLKQNAEGGHIVNTASIGGLATMPSLGGYSVTKFGVVALTETLALELQIAESNVNCTVLVPGPVHTNIQNSSRNRPKALHDAKLADVDLTEIPAMAELRWLEPDDVGDLIISAIQRKTLYCFTHPELFAPIESRFAQITSANLAAQSPSE
ncbi:SDR family NAD(P)-dependent oxidoreductase [Pseudomonas sp. 13B_2.1_Bac1]|uniref:SDR family NAD(P)-dependent oxidoreductase n=1 Tax=Pseudomonas sp. 13B_2.1_Bac1 TaxID=2971624 RepID=UPI0021C5E94F|nr:SDR family NAD(P)-dependent oxidoreductase [Pseudomonas sp. 13B_2.1_Bac1]MCU1785183.1 SDR family NAD(P)-dependent oxidoreductase [Pseudomonas sp. 13B_2.1_Bac1]